MKNIIILISICILCILLLNSCYTILTSDIIYKHEETISYSDWPKPKYKKFSPDYKKAFITNPHLLIYSSNGGYKDKPDRQVLYKICLDDINDTNFQKSTITRDSINSKTVFSANYKQIFKEDTSEVIYDTNQIQLENKYETIKTNAGRNEFFIKDRNRQIVVTDSLNTVYYTSNDKYFYNADNIEPNYEDYSFLDDLTIQTYDLDYIIDTLFYEYDSIPIVDQEHKLPFYNFYTCYDNNFISYEKNRNDVKHFLFDTVSYFLIQEEYKNGFIYNIYGNNWVYCRYDQTNPNVLLINSFSLPKVSNDKLPFFYPIKLWFYKLRKWNYANLLYGISVPLDIVTGPIQIIIFFITWDGSIEWGGY